MGRKRGRDRVCRRECSDRENMPLSIAEACGTANGILVAQPYFCLSKHFIYREAAPSHAEQEEKARTASKEPLLNFLF